MADTDLVEQTKFTRKHIEKNSNRIFEIIVYIGAFTAFSGAEKYNSETG